MIFFQSILFFYFPVYIEMKHGDPKDKPWKPEDKKETTVCALGNTKDGYFNEGLEKEGAKMYLSSCFYFFFSF